MEAHSILVNDFLYKSHKAFEKIEDVAEYQKILFEVIENNSEQYKKDIKEMSKFYMQEIMKKKFEKINQIYEQAVKQAEKEKK